MRVNETPIIENTFLVQENIRFVLGSDYESPLNLEGGKQMEMSMTLFKQRYVDDVWVEQREAMERQCVQVSDEEILTSDLEELSQQIAKPYHFDVPDVLVDQLSRDEPWIESIQRPFGQRSKAPAPSESTAMCAGFYGGPTSFSENA